MLLPSLPAAAAAAFWAAGVSVVNLLALRRLGSALYNQAGALLPLPTIVLAAAAAWLVFGLAGRLGPIRERPTPADGAGPTAGC